MSVTLVLGAARSGKSRYALAQAQARGAAPVMIATAEALDAEMRDRIATHRAERDARWRTVEAPLDLPGALRSLRPDDVAVVDCLTLWLSNLFMADRDPEEAAAELVAALGGPAEVWLVSNEVGWGIVPESALARRFRDEAGRLNQQVAEAADRVVLVVAGQALVIKPQR